LRWRFHANQAVEPQPDGSVIVRFRASGMLELAWHLFTWGDKVEILAPPALKATLIEQLAIAQRAHTSGPVVAGA
jgi:predicted DNA-binding transcriptional regulator YafY